MAFTLAVLDIMDSENGRVLKCLTINNLDPTTARIDFMSDRDFIQSIKVTMSNRNNSSKDDTLVFANFSISKTEQFKIEDSAGSFSRLKDKNGVSPRVILAEYVSEAGRILGYVIADKNGRVSRVKRDELLGICEKAKRAGVPFIQNAIYRTTNGTSMLAAYPGHEFYKLTQRLKKKVAEPKVAEHIAKAKVVKEEAPVAKPSKAEPNKKVSETPAKAAPVKNSERYSEAQKKELIAAKKNGVDPLIVSNPKLSPEQMRIIWTAKKNNRASEYFANPKFSVEQMQFFADRLVDKKIFTDCRGFISPKYSVEQLAELYLGVCDGIDYTQYANPELSAEDMYIKRTELTCSTYASVLVGSGVNERSSRNFLKRNNLDIED